MFTLIWNRNGNTKLDENEIWKLIDIFVTKAQRSTIYGLMAKGYMSS